MRPARRLLRWWRAPLWLLALATGAKSFADNPLLGSARLNRIGLHVRRKQLAHVLARWRRSRLAHLLPPALRERFDRDGFILIPDLLPAAEFGLLQSALLGLGHDGREHQQGDTLTSRVAVGPALLARVPHLAALLDSARWKGVMAYVGATRSAPLYYIQTIAAGVVDGPPDPQLELHSDTFHPSLKAWLFLTDVPADGRPLTYVAGSHRLTPERTAWEKRRSTTVMTHGDRLSQRGSLRVAPDELPALGLPSPTRFSVPANTLVAIDTCGFHARADSDRPTLRVELWAYSRRSPFLPWTGGDPLSWRPIAIRRAEWLAAIVDWLAARGWMVQHWRPRAPAHRSNRERLSGAIPGPAVEHGLSDHVQDTPPQLESIMNENLVSAVFDNQAEAERAVAKIRAAGVADNAISVIAQQDGKNTTSDGSGAEAATDVVGKTALGAGAGTLLGIAALAIPGVGPLVAAGAIASVAIPGAALTGAAVGAAAGGLAGLLSDHGVDSEDAAYYEERVNNGGVFVSVDTNDAGLDAQSAREMLYNAGGHSSSQAKSAANAY